MMKNIGLILSVSWLFASGCTNSTTKTNTTTTTQPDPKEETLPPKQIKKDMYAEESIYARFGEGLYAHLDITEGDVLIKLEMERAPLTTANFVALAKGEMPNPRRGPGEPYYDGLTFHRVISLLNNGEPDFMIQGGDPAGDGTGGPGYQFRDEINPNLRHDRPGVVAMANSGPSTNGSQFYIMIAPWPSLDGSYNIFGQVVDGQDHVNRTLQGDKIRTIKIFAVGEAARNFNAMEKFNELKNEVPDS